MNETQIAQALKPIYAPRVIIGDELRALHGMMTSCGLATTQRQDGAFLNEGAARMQWVWMAAVEWACKAAARQLAEELPKYQIATNDEGKITAVRSLTLGVAADKGAAIVVQQLVDGVHKVLYMEEHPPGDSMGVINLGASMVHPDMALPSRTHEQHQAYALLLHSDNTITDLTAQLDESEGGHHD